MGLQAKQPAPFNDIANYADQSKDEIGAAYKAGIIKGYEGKFNPGALVMCHNKNKCHHSVILKGGIFTLRDKYFGKEPLTEKR